MFFHLFAVAVVVIASYKLAKWLFTRRHVDFCRTADPQRLNAVYLPPAGSRLHVYTVATRQDHGLDLLAASCRAKGLGLHVLGLGNAWRGYGNKWIWTAEAMRLQNLPPDDVVLFLDGFDTLNVADEAEILEKFHSSGARVILNAERNCWPDPELASNHPPTRSSFKYVNSGGVIGHASEILRIVDAIGLLSTDNDQRGFMRYFLDHPGEIVLDDTCRIFVCLFGMKEDELDIDLENRRVTVRETGERPCFIHGNGPSMELYHAIAKKMAGQAGILATCS